jgi:type IV pilus biogenesis protein CpaD/CtpE
MEIMRLKTRPVLAVLALTATVGLTACGSDEKSTTTEAAATPDKAIAEIGETRDALDQGLAAFKAGKSSQAQEILSEAYVQHFEEVEGPLEEVDHELKEKLEDAIAYEIRDKVEQGAPVAEVEALVKSVKADLDSAEGKLR